jgi:DNA-directed RNA polymerase subunit RPC12/RpoP
LILVEKGCILSSTKGEVMKTYECFKCGHKWVPRTDKKPEQCPHCKNVKWDKRKENEQKGIKS